VQRRDFCKLFAAATAAQAMPALPQSTQLRNFPPLNGFDSPTQEYAEFCATAEDKRVFFELLNGQFAKVHLDPATWQVSPNSESGPKMPPSLPVPGGSWNGVPMLSPITGLAGDGPYQPTWESMLAYEVPEWYQDAKFGIWAHWGPQCVPEAGDWYARNMYMQGSTQYQYHLQHYGHPSKFGFKDLCPQWTLLNWKPEDLMLRYHKAGARFFLALANHHDNLDTWDSKHHPWNAVNIGPRRDVVGTWAAQARKLNMRFGVTVHQPRNWWWLQTAHGSDTTGPLAGVPYDGHLTAADGAGQWWQGMDPQQMYAPKHPPMALPDISYVKNFYDRTRDLIDRHDPDLLYLDNALLPLGWGGMNISAYFYNRSLKLRQGRMEAVITTKQVPDNLLKALVADYERGTTSSLAAYPWQSETCIGGWHYDRALFQAPGEFGGYMHPTEVIHWLIDTVSKNGTFVLNIPGRPDGTIDSKEIAVLDQLTAWMQVHGEAIYETRPWTTYGEGPNVRKGASAQNAPRHLDALDIRFTRNKANTVVYAFFLGSPNRDPLIESFGKASPHCPGAIAQVELLGHGARLQFQQRMKGLSVKLPSHDISDAAIALKVSLA
jgi:alpha-L-fucosidase